MGKKPAKSSFYWRKGQNASWQRAAPEAGRVVLAHASPVPAQPPSALGSGLGVDREQVGKRPPLQASTGPAGAEARGRVKDRKTNREPAASTRLPEALNDAKARPAPRCGRRALGGVPLDEAPPFSPCPLPALPPPPFQHLRIPSRGPDPDQQTGRGRGTARANIGGGAWAGLSRGRGPRWRGRGKYRRKTKAMGDLAAPKGPLPCYQSVNNCHLLPSRLWSSRRFWEDLFKGPPF